MIHEVHVFAERVHQDLNELIFDYLFFVMQQFQWREEHQVSSRHTMFVFLLLLTFVHCLAQPEWLGLACFFAVAMMRSALEYCMFKALPYCHLEH
jgi:hypothetical protein